MTMHQKTPPLRSVPTPSFQRKRPGICRSFFYPALALLLYCFAMASAHAQVSPGDVLIGEDENNYYYMSRPDYQGSAAQKYGMEYCRNRKAVTADQRAIREMGFALDAQRFEMFENVARDQ